MKRVSLHLLFWLLFWLQDVLLQFTWMAPYQTNMSQGEQLSRSIQVTLALLFSKAAVVYYILYQVIPRIGNGRDKLAISLLKMFLAFCGGVVLVRLTQHYFVNPYINHDKLNNVPIFRLRELLVSLLDIGFVVGLAIPCKFARLQLATKEKEKNLIRDKLETELKFLRNQTNPHFLMNTLNNIYGLARKNSAETPEAILKLSELLQFILYETTSNFISLADEVKVCEGYLDLERLRYNKRLTVCFKKELDSDAYPISPLLLLPFIENAFKHGISETRFESFIHVLLKVQDGQLDFSVENAKEDGEHARSKKTIGLSNVKRQLELTYTDYDLQVLDEPAVFKIRLQINLHTHVQI